MDQRKPRILVAHPGKQHSFRLASALKKAEMLDCYCTTIYDKKTSFLMRIVKRIIQGGNLSRAENRKNPDLNDDEVIQFCEFWGLVTIISARLDKSKRRIIYRTINGFTSDQFGRKVAKLAIKKQVDAVICYDTGALKCWEILVKEAPQIKRIMDSSHMARPAEKELLEEETKKTGNNSLKEENYYLWNDKILNRFQKEIDYTQYFLCPSQFLSKSLIKCGINKHQCLIIPYGANVQSNRILNEKKDGTIKFLFVGGVSYAKGVHHLLSEFSKIDSSRAELTLVGACNHDSDLYKNYSAVENIHFMGWMMAEQVKKQYESADVFVLYSPREGMAQVGIEAMACGLPIIVSDHTGVNDLVDEGINGFVIPYGNNHLLYEKMSWFLDNSDSICKMGTAARQTAKQYTWQRYEEEIQKALADLISVKSKE